MKFAYNNNNNSNMLLLLHGFVLISILATAICAEAEVNMEAAFQGHCGHTSPCEQLCYEIHDGMYECDCIEGYELNKNGYSCQVINATAPSKSDEDVLYQKGASFSAKLADNDKYGSYAAGASNSVSGGTSSASYETDDERMNFSNENIASTTSDEDIVNSNDYYISSESINMNNDPEHEIDVNDADFIYPNNNNNNKNPDVPESRDTSKSRTKYIQIIERKSIPIKSEQPKLITTRAKGTSKPKIVATTTSTTTEATTATTTTTTTTTKARTITTNNNNNYNPMEENNYYMQPDMSVYDDVNNNQLNLRPLDHNTYQSQRTAISDAQKETNNNFKINIDKKWTEDIEDVIHIKNRTIIHIKSTANNGSEECTLNCGTEGVCDNKENEPKCLCGFGKTGALCNDDILVSVPKFSHKSWLAFSALRGAYKHLQLHIEFRPEAFDGVLLLSGERDDLTGDFLALLLNKGFVEFWFDCGSGVGSVRSRETILLNEWNTVVIYRHRWDAWLILNHGTKVQGRSNGLFSRITFREPVFLGGSGNITGIMKRLPINNGFTGCIRRFVANEHTYNFAEHPTGDVMQGFNIQECITDKCFKYPCQHGGKCQPTDQGAVCLCPMGFVGDLCEIRMDLQIPAFNGSSFLRHGPIEDTGLIWLELKVILKPERTDGLILYSGPKQHGDYIALSLNAGYVEFEFDLGSGAAVVRSKIPLSVGQWHTIKISRTARLAVLKIDELAETMTISPNGFWHLSLPENLFIGGVSHVVRLPNALKNKPFFVGCIQMVDINGHTLSIISEALGGTNIGNCPHTCLARPCGAYAECIPQLESYECRCHDGHASCTHRPKSHAKNILHKLHWNKSQSHYLHKLAKPEAATSFPFDGLNYENVYVDDVYQQQEQKEMKQHKKPKHKLLKHRRHKDVKNKHKPSIKQSDTKHTVPYLPAHYASFQSNGNVLTFGDDVHINMQHDTDAEDSAPFVIDETIFAGDDLTEDYQRKQLAQDMRRIMANTPARKQNKLPPTYDQETDTKNHIEETEPAMNEEYNAQMLYKSASTPQTHTDWSVLKQLDLAADYQSHIGVRKNFGACFAGTNSYFHYDDAETMRHINTYNVDLNLRIKTHSPYGVLLWTSRQPSSESDDYADDFLSLGIENGFLHFRYNLGVGEVNIVFNNTKVSDGLWHRVRAIRDAHSGYLEIDGRKSTVQHATSTMRQMHANSGVYVGGLPEGAHFKHKIYHSGIIGCISEIVLSGELKLNFDANTLGTAHNVETGIL